MPEISPRSTYHDPEHKDVSPPDHPLKAGDEVRVIDPEHSHWKRVNDHTIQVSETNPAPGPDLVTCVIEYVFPAVPADAEKGIEAVPKVYSVRTRDGKHSFNAFEEQLELAGLSHVEEVEAKVFEERAKERAAKDKSAAEPAPAHRLEHSSTPPMRTVVPTHSHGPSSPPAPHTKQSAYQQRQAKREAAEDDDK